MNRRECCHRFHRKLYVELEYRGGRRDEAWNYQHTKPVSHPGSQMASAAHWMAPGTPCNPGEGATGRIIPQGTPSRRINSLSSLLVYSASLYLLAGTPWDDKQASRCFGKPYMSLEATLASSSLIICLSLLSWIFICLVLFVFLKRLEPRSLHASGISGTLCAEKRSRLAHTMLCPCHYCFFLNCFTRWFFFSFFFAFLGLLRFHINFTTNMPISAWNASWDFDRDCVEFIDQFGGVLTS